MGYHILKQFKYFLFRKWRDVLHNENSLTSVTLSPVMEPSLLIILLLLTTIHGQDSDNATSAEPSSIPFGKYHYMYFAPI